MSPAGSPAEPPSPTATPAPAGTTGILRLDRELGPLPHGTRLLILHDSAVDPNPFLHHVLAEHVRLHGPALHACATDTPRGLMEDHRRLGFEADRLAHDLAFVDLRDPSALEQLAAGDPAARRRLTILEALATVGADRGEELFRAAPWSGPLAVATWPLADGEAAPPGLLEAAHAVVRLRRREAGGTRVETFQVQQRPSDGQATRAFPYRVDRPGGVRPYLAKVLVTGPHNSGKTSLVHTLSQTGVSVERLGTTVAMDHGRVERHGVTVELFGTPGQERFDPIIRQIAQGAVGVLVLVDSTRPSTFLRARTLAEATAVQGTPLVFAATKQDVAAARPLHEVRAGLQVPADVPVIGLVATDADQAAGVLDVLIERVLTAGRPTE
jgi:small GTP-binding protein